MENRCYYPCRTVNISQSYTGDFSHAGNLTGFPADYPIDEAGKDAGRDWMYCPCDEMQVVRVTGVGNSYTNTIWLTSSSPVSMPCGEDYLTMMVIHPNDDDLSKIKVGQKFRRGEALFREGTDGYATGNHFHISFGRGKIVGNGWTCNSQDAWVLTTAGGAIRPEEACYVDESFTKIISTRGLEFRTIKNGEDGQAMKGCIYIGHGKSANGGYDPGAVNERLQLHEFKLCREIGKYAHAALKEYEDLTVDLVNDDGSLNLNERISHANKGGYDWIVEIHLNSFSSQTANGTEAYYYKGTEDGRKIADHVCRELSKALGIFQRSNGVKGDDGGDKVTDYFGIVVRTKPAAVLVETLFISNDNEVKKIINAEGQRKAGEAIARGIAAAFGLRKKEPEKTMRYLWVGHFSTLEGAEAAKRKIDALGYYNKICVDKEYR